MKYAVEKRPGEPAKLVEVTTSTVGYHFLKEALDECTIAMTTARLKEGKIVDVWCDEEGLLKNLPLNFFHPQIRQPIVGPVLVCDHDNEGESVPLSKELAEEARNWLDTVAGL